MPRPDPPLTAGDVLSPAELRHLRRTSTLRGLGLVAHAWTVIAGAVALYALWPGWLTGVLAVLVIGSRQLGLMVLVHEAAHWRLLSQVRANTLLATWLCAHPIWADLPAYRRRHHLHHRHLQQPEDPDLPLAVPAPLASRRLWAAFARDLCGLTALARVRALLPWRAAAPGAWRRLGGPALANLLLLGVAAALGRWPLYVLFWVLPMATWYQAVARLRDLAEHSVVPEAVDPLRNARTVTAGPLARAFLAPYWVSYHLEHHLLVFVPCWKLREAHALLLAKGYGRRMEVAAGYGRVVGRLTSPDALPLLASRR